MAIFVINVTGSFALGVVLELLLRGPDVGPRRRLRLLIGTGFMGGYTIFSTASLETVRLVQNHEYTLALSNGLGILVIAVLVGLAGLWLGTSL